MEKIIDILLRYEKFSRETIHLTANENLPTLRERLPFFSDVFARYTFDEHSPWKSLSYGLDDVENTTCEKLKQLLECKYVNVRPISGLNGMLTVLASFNSSGDTVMVLNPKHGGHGETAEILRLLNLKVEYLPFCEERWQIDTEKLREILQNQSVNMIYIDLCMVAFPQPLEEIKRTCGNKTIIVYDASHVLGLVMGKRFQQPLKEGADIIISSTHKTFPGPHKAVFATNKHLYFKLFNERCRHFVSQQHEADIACLGMVLERGEGFFVPYADNIVENAKLLGKRLYDCGIQVQMPHLDFTESHQLWLDCGSEENVDAVIKLLNGLQIVVNKAQIPSMNMRCGIRIGVQEITQNGITKEGLCLLADILTEIIQTQKITSETRMKREQLLNIGFRKHEEGASFIELFNVLNAEK